MMSCGNAQLGIQPDDWTRHIEDIVGEKLPPIVERTRETTERIAGLVERVEMRKAIARGTSDDAQLDELMDAIAKAEARLNALRNAATHAMAGGINRRLTELAERIAPCGVLLRAMRDDLEIESLSLEAPDGWKVYVNDGRIHFEVELAADRPAIGDLIDLAVAGERGKV